VALTLTEPPGEVTHWTAAAVAAACAISVSSVHRIWRSRGLRPHQIRQFKLSSDPQFAGKRKLIPTVDGQWLGLQAGFGVMAAL
jgi:DNA-binding MurR/RpiR family transcriptional regulator